jgi:hypothetical protein
MTSPESLKIIMLFLAYGVSLGISAALLHNVPKSVGSRHFRAAFHLQTGQFGKWAMLGSNQRPLPCEGSEAVSHAL